MSAGIKSVTRSNEYSANSEMSGRSDRINAIPDSEDSMEEDTLEHYKDKEIEQMKEN